MQSYFKTVWPSGLRRWLQAPVRKGVGSNPTAVMLVSWGGLAHARLGLACVHRAAMDRRRRRATYREVKLRRPPLRQLAERPGARHQVACRFRTAGKTMIRQDPSARAPRKQTLRRLLGQPRAVEVRGAPRLRKSHAIRQGHVGLRRHSARNASAAAIAKFFGTLQVMAVVQAMQVPVWPNG